MTDAAIRAFCAQQREWLDLELQSSEEEVKDPNATEEGRSHVLHQLETSDVSVGLYGRTVVRLIALTSESTEVLLPSHRFTTGDEVEIRSKAEKDHPSGVVSEVSETYISIALFPSRKNKDDDNDNEQLSPPLSLFPKSSIEVHRKLIAALDELEKQGTNHSIAGKVVQALFEVQDDKTSIQAPSSLQPFNTKLDHSQLEAIAFAHTPHCPISLIHG